MTVTDAQKRPSMRASRYLTVLLIGAVVSVGCSSLGGRSETVAVEQRPVPTTPDITPDIELPISDTAPTGADPAVPATPGESARATTVDASSTLRQLLPVDPDAVPSDLASSGRTQSLVPGDVAPVDSGVAAIPDASASEQQALASISYNWRAALPGWSIRFLPARAGIRGSTRPSERLIDIYVRRSDTTAELAHVIAHELGHALDVTWLTSATRSSWASTRRFSSDVSWFVADGTSDFASGAGDFAESFAWWQTGGAHWAGQLAGPPSSIELGVLASLVPWR